MIIFLCFFCNYLCDTLFSALMKIFKCLIVGLNVLRNKVVPRSGL